MKPNLTPLQRKTIIPPKRSCGNCRARRSQCDRAVPSCSQCSSSKVKCSGYGLRLSWPRPGDTRRSSVAVVSPSADGRPCAKMKDIVEITTWDIRMHYHLSSLRCRYSRPKLYVPMTWNPSELELGEQDLLQYFCSHASLSLTTFGHDPKALGLTLIRIALAGNTPSSVAVFQGILALSSLHRHGVQTQAFKFKIATIRALGAATTSTLGAKEVIQHAAAGMLLCSFEVHQASCTSSQWTWYIAGVKDLLAANCLQNYSTDCDLLALTSWVRYHDVMSRFTLRHWEGEVPKPAPRLGEDGDLPVRVPAHLSKSANVSKVSREHTSFSMLAMLELLAELSDAVTCRPHSGNNAAASEDFNEYLRILIWRINKLKIEKTCRTPLDDSLHIPTPDTIVELYRLSTLIYIYRILSSILTEDFKLESHIKHAFTLLSHLECCERQFPLFIIGCEARTDEQRLLILGLITRTEQRNSSRSLNHIKILVKALWTQDDLAQKELDYWDKLSSVISSCTIVPSLV